MKLNELLKNNNVTVQSFPAFKQLESHSNKDASEITLSTFSPNFVLENTKFSQTSYFAPVIPRNSRFENAEQIMQADLDVNLVTVEYTDEITSYDKVIIASRHESTVKILKKEFPNSVVLAHVEEIDILGKKVVGTLPPHLISLTQAYKSVIIKDFDYNKDGDLKGQELLDRLVISPTVCVTLK